MTNWADFEERYGERKEEHMDDEDDRCPECGGWLLEDDGLCGDCEWRGEENE